MRRIITLIICLGLCTLLQAQNMYEPHPYEYGHNNAGATYTVTGLNSGWNFQYRVEVYEYDWKNEGYSNVFPKGKNRLLEVIYETVNDRPGSPGQFPLMCLRDIPTGMYVLNFNYLHNTEEVLLDLKKPFWAGRGWGIELTNDSKYFYLNHLCDIPY
jgi:hypothetical protein